MKIKYWIGPLLVAGSFLDASKEKDVTLKQRNISVDFSKTVSSVSNKINRALVTSNLPGASVVVHVNGRPVVKMGAGFSDIENNTPFHSQTSMRIASISKLITSMITLRLYQQEKLDLDSSVAELLQSKNLNFLYQDTVQDISVRQLLNHTAGIRHYKSSEVCDSDAEEFICNRNFPTVYDGLEMFKHDELITPPGRKYNYTTFGYSLLSFVLEQASEVNFATLVSDFTKALDLKETRLDNHKNIIPNRCRYYRTEDGKLINSPFVDNSCKWAGGGMVSTAEDIAKLGDILMYCYQSKSSKNFLTCVDTMIADNEVTRGQRTNGTVHHYGLGVTVDHPLKENGQTRQRFQFSHTGGAVGASSILLVRPSTSTVEDQPSGITVVIFCNHEKGGTVIRLANEIANMVEEEIHLQSGF